jgi:hypothetical protein
MPDPVAMQQSASLAVRGAMETLGDGAKLQPYEVSLLKATPETAMANIVAELAERCVRLEEARTKLSVRVAKAEKRLEELEAAPEKAKPSPRKKKPVAEEQY